MTQPTPDFATFRTWYESAVADLIVMISTKSGEATPEHVEAFSLIANIYMLAIQTRNSDLMAANAEHIYQIDEARRQHMERDSQAFERIAAALEALARKERTP